jgi:hypothetical protein
MVATVAVASGVGLIVLPFALSLFPRAAAGERILDRFRQTMSVAGLHSLATNFATMGGAVDQFINQASPQLAHQLGMTPAQFAAYEQHAFPAVSAAVTGIPPLVAFVAPVNAQLQALHPPFASVDSLPFLGLPLTTIPWLLLAAGVALIGVGAWTLRGRRRASLAAAGVLGAALLAIPLALSYPSKASDAARVQAVGRVALSQAAVDGATKANALIDGLVTQVQGRMVPVLAQRLGSTSAQFGATLAREYPRVAKGLAAWPSIKPGALHLVALQRASVSDAVSMNGLAFRPLPWYIMGPAIALLLAVGAALPKAVRDDRFASAEIALTTAPLDRVGVDLRPKAHR